MDLKVCRPMPIILMHWNASSRIKVKFGFYRSCHYIMNLRYVKRIREKFFWKNFSKTIDKEDWFCYDNDTLTGVGVFLYDLIGADLFCHIKIRGSAGTLSKILNGKSLRILGDFSCNKLNFFHSRQREME